MMNLERPRARTGGLRLASFLRFADILVRLLFAGMRALPFAELDFAVTCFSFFSLARVGLCRDMLFFFLARV